MSHEPGDSSSQPATFLLAEHTRLSELYLATRETAERRVTLYLTLTTTIVGVSVALWQLGLQQTQLVEMILASAVGIFLLGFITFNRLLERGMRGTEYLRAINRIHRYFVEHAPETRPYLYWDAADDQPHYDSRGVGGVETREVVQIADCLFFAIATGMLILLIDFNQQLAALGAALVAFGVMFVAHRRYETVVLAREEKRKRAMVRFPAFPEEPK